jgi:hypothetical protein
MVAYWSCRANHHGPIHLREYLLVPDALIPPQNLIGHQRHYVLSIDNASDYLQIPEDDFDVCNGL